MIATLPATYSFECPHCSSTLSLPVELEGITGPCPQCQQNITAPPYPRPAFAAPHGDPLTETQEWSTPVPPPAAVPQDQPPPVAALPTWDDLIGAAPESPPPAESPPALGNTPQQRSPWLVFGLLAGIAGLGAAIYLMLHPLPFAAPMAPPSAPKNVAPIAPSPAPSPVAETTPPAPESSPLPPDADLPTAEAPIPDPPPTEVVAPEIQPAVAETPGSSLLSDPKLESTPPPVAKIVPEETPADPAVLQEPRAALQAFLAASGWKERLPLIQNGEALRPIIEEYYANHSDGPIKADSIDFLTSQPTPDEKGVFFLFQVQVHDEHGFPVAVENMQGNYRIDWRSFVEFKDLLLPKFFERYSPDPATFHVVLKRSHYFGSDVPDQEHKLCFSAEPPVPGFQNYVWVSDDSQALITKLGVRSEFGQTAYPVVSLRWLKEKNGTAYVLLDDIVSDNWRADEARAVLPVKPKSPKKR